MRATVEQSTVVSALIPASQRTTLSPRAIRAAVLGITFLVYASTLGYQFVYDVRGQIVDNPLIKSWHYLPQYFSDHVWSFLDPSQHGNYYRPLFVVWLLINHTLFGLNPIGWHLTTILVHLGVTYLVFLLVRRLVNNETTAGIAALIFGLHPVHIESVAWISGITDPLLALFFIPSLLFYLRAREWEIDHRDEPGQAHLYRRPAFNSALSLLFFLLALLSKETAMVLPGIMAVYELVYGQRESRWRTVVRQIIPYAAVAIVYLVVRTLVLKSLGYAAWPLPLSVTLMTVPSVLWFYIRLLLWPVGLSAYYDTLYVTHVDFTFWMMVIGLVAIAAGLWQWGRKSKPVAVALSLLVLPILPVLNLSAFQEKEIAHDRYLYLPSIGFAILLAVVIGKLRYGKYQIASLPAAQASVILVVMLIFAALTLQQSPYWTTNLELCRHGVAVAPNNDIATTNYADELSRLERVDEAIPIYEVVINRNPTLSRASWNIGTCFINKGDKQTALKYRMCSKEMDELLKSPVSVAALVRMRLGRLDEAADMLRRAIAGYPEIPSYQYGSGMMVKSDVAARYQQYIASHPELPAYQYGLGIVLKEAGDIDGALAAFKAAALGNPDPLAVQTQIDELESRVNHGAPGTSGSINAPLKDN